MPASFRLAYELVKKWENRQTKDGLIVYSNIAGDKGGETVLGVARNIHSNLKIWDDIDKLKDIYGTKDKITLSKAILEDKNIINTIEMFYYNEFWLKAKCNIINNNNFACNVMLLSVNAGVKRGVKVGQEACGIKADGIIGKQTLKAWQEAGNKEAKNYTAIEIEYYKSIAEKNPSQAKFLAGWINRANAI